jgi:D-glycero-D-manno-heptose 1,7-bisphosphate phosphatase
MIAFCPHTPNEHCDCRKPNTGLLKEIANRMNINLVGVPLIGDSVGDIIAARRVGATPWLVMTGKGKRTLAQLRAQDEISDDLVVCSDLCAAVSVLLNREN